jgi:hypothetical protein
MHQLPMGSAEPRPKHHAARARRSILALVAAEGWPGPAERAEVEGGPVGEETRLAEETRLVLEEETRLVLEQETRLVLEEETRVGEQVRVWEETRLEETQRSAAAMARVPRAAGQPRRNLRNPTTDAAAEWFRLPGLDPTCWACLGSCRC